MSETNGNGKWPLPEGWVEVTLADVAHVERGITFPASVKSSELFSGGIACLRTTNVQEFVDWSDLIFVPEEYVRKEEKLTRSNDILISMANSYELVGKVSFVDHVPVPSTFGGFIASIRSFESISPKFLFYFLRNKETQSFLRRNSSQTVNIANISLHSLYPTPIPLPPLSQQHRIVAEIEKQFTRLDAAVAALKRAKANLARYKAAVLKAAVEGRLVPQDPNDEPAAALLARVLTERRAQWEAANPKKPYVEPKRPDVNGLPELPVGWVWATVETLGEVQLGRQRAPQHHDGPYMRPYLRVANVFEDRIDTDNVLDMNFSPTEFETYLLRYGDILLNEGQSLELVGRPAMFRDEIQGACFQNTLVRFRVFDGLNRDYALTVFRAYLHNGRFQKIAKWTTNIAHLGTTRFAELEFALPPIKEQNRIVEELQRQLSIVASSEQAIILELARAERLRQGVLGKAFRGKLV